MRSVMVPRNLRKNEMRQKENRLQEEEGLCLFALCSVEQPGPVT